MARIMKAIKAITANRESAFSFNIIRLQILDGV